MKAFSAPGKALVAGGYLVLEPIYDAYVTALSCRMHAVVKGEESDRYEVTVKSPQFVEGEWHYVKKEGIVEANDRKNPFLEAAVLAVTEYVKPQQGYSLSVTIYSDPGFHTQANAEVHKSLNGEKLFLYHSKPITEVEKTGLGSSASLVTVVTTALLSYFNVSDIDVIHNLAQIAHCKAQGKIGSGFDVAAAVYGSIKYRRFDPGIINDYLHQEAAIGSVVDQNWHFTHDPCALPPRVSLLMGDIKGGSETPRLVSKVLNWKKSFPAESDQLYCDLNDANSSLITALSQLHQCYNEDAETYNRNIDFLSKRSMDYITSFLTISKKTETVLQPFLNLSNSIKAIRSNLRALTRFTNATIEPPSQTVLLNQCCTLPGVIGGVVPGAGGYDAICLLVVSSSIDTIISSTKQDSRFDNVTWLNLKEQSSGVVAETPEDYGFN